MNIRLRLETSNDHRAVEIMTREAFWGFTAPTCDEHYLVHILREIPAFLPELDYVAEDGGRIVGNVMFTRAKVVDACGAEHAVVTFGPLSVLPAYWGKGVGTALMRRSLLEAKRMGHRAVIFYGHPDYYPRFGFQNARVFGITNPQGRNFDALMAMPLYDGALDGISGKFTEDPAFEVKAEDAEAFNRQMPPKEPAVMTPIDVLLDRLNPAAQKAFKDHNYTVLARLNGISGRELLTWEGIVAETLAIINEVLAKHGHARKLLPDSEILRRAKLGVRVLEDAV